MVALSANAEEPLLQALDRRLPNKFLRIEKHRDVVSSKGSLVSGGAGSYNSLVIFAGCETALELTRKLTKAGSRVAHDEPRLA